MLRVRLELGTLMGSIGACATCARDRPPPEGTFSGGFCCGKPTLALFTEDELAALALSGTTPERMVAPRDAHAGCAFRGRMGCALAVADRPNICVRFLCRDAMSELRRKDALKACERVALELASVWTGFLAARAERLLAEELNPA
jgi:hypothetical protein